MLRAEEKVRVIDSDKSYLSDDLFFNVLNDPKKLADPTTQEKILAEIKKEMQDQTLFEQFNAERRFMNGYSVTPEDCDRMTHALEKYQHDLYYQKRLYWHPIMRINKLAELLKCETTQATITRWAIRIANEILARINATTPPTVFIYTKFEDLNLFTVSFGIQQLFAEDMRVAARDMLEQMIDGLLNDSNQVTPYNVMTTLTAVKPLQLSHEPIFESILDTWVLNAMRYGLDKDYRKILDYLTVLTLFQIPIKDKKNQLLSMLELLDPNNFAYADVICRLDKMHLLTDLKILTIILNKPTSLPDADQYVNQYIPAFIKDAWNDPAKKQALLSSDEQTLTQYLHKIERQMISLTDTLEKNKLKNSRGTHISIFPILPILPHNHGTFTSIKKALADLKQCALIIKKIQGNEAITAGEHAHLLKTPEIGDSVAIQDYMYVFNASATHRKRK